MVLIGLLFMKALKEKLNQLSSGLLEKRWGRWFLLGKKGKLIGIQQILFQWRISYCQVLNQKNKIIFMEEIKEEEFIEEEEYEEELEYVEIENHKRKNK